MATPTEKKLRAEIASLKEQLAQALARKEGVRSDGTVDKYTNMQSAELRELVERAGGDPDEIVEGFHSRQRAIKMREWLRANVRTKKTTAAKDTKPAKKTTRKPEPAPVVKKKPKAKAETPAPKAKTKKKTRKL
jgi:hypothetical protein